MTKLSQKSFVSGQYDRTAQNQESLSGGGVVASGMAHAKNVLSSDKGELRKRLGTKFIKELNGATVIVPFRKTDNDDVVLLCDNTNITGLVYQGGNAEPLMIASSDAPTFPNTGWTSNTNGNYTVNCNSNSSAVWGVGFNNVERTYPNGAPYAVKRTSASYPAWVSIASNDPQVLGSMYFMWNQTCNGSHVGAYKGWLNPVIQYSDDNLNWVSVQTGVYQGNNDSSNNPGVYQVSKYADGRTQSKTSYRVENTSHRTPHKYWRIYFMDRIYNNTTYDGERLEYFCWNIKYVSSESVEYSDTMTFSDLKGVKYAQNENTLIMACKDTVPQKLTYTNGTFVKAEVTAISTWGKPTCVEYFQNRLWFGGFDAYPTTVIASKFGDYEHFTVAQTVQYDDYLNLKCNQLKSQITNIKGGQKVMYVFSEDGISNIDGGSSGMVATNQNIEFILKNRMPAGDATPAFKDDVMLYTSSDGTKVYSVDYDLLTSRFQVNDIAMYAKDITSDKVTEMHYLNNESKLVYALTENNTMFALLYEKGGYQGFFPLDFGGDVYDICPIKVGRDYKLLMVINRNGRWYLEEKLDTGKYIDTSAPRMTSEDKKWATYDNLENNIALDCYNTYDEHINTEIMVMGENKLITSIDLSDYVDKTIMLGNSGSKYWNLYTVDSTSNFANWGLSSELSYGYYTFSNVPAVGDYVYDSDGRALYSVLGYSAGVLSVGHIVEPGQITPVYQLYRHDEYDKYASTVTLEAKRGDEKYFTILYPEFDAFQSNLPAGTDVGVISEGRYFGELETDDGGTIELPVPCHKVIYGVNYEALAIFKIQTPYESMKNISQVDVSVLNTTHLEVGTVFNDTINIEKINDSSYYDLTSITMNDTYRIVLTDTPESTKNLILRSNCGVPFTVNALDMYINYSNLGGD